MNKKFSKSSYFHSFHFTWTQEKNKRKSTPQSELPNCSGLSTQWNRSQHHPKYNCQPCKCQRTMACVLLELKWSEITSMLFFFFFSYQMENWTWIHKQFQYLIPNNVWYLLDFLQRYYSNKKSNFRCSMHHDLLFFKNDKIKSKSNTLIT